MIVIERVLPNSVGKANITLTLKSDNYITKQKKIKLQPVFLKNIDAKVLKVLANRI